MVSKMISKSITLSLLLFASASLAFAAPETGGPIVRTAGDFMEACKKAGASNKKAAVLFTDVSTAIYKQHFSGPMAGIANENYVVLHIDQGAVPGVEALFRISRYPTLVIADAAGAEIDRIAGPFHQRDAVSLLRACARGTSELEALKARAASPKASAADRVNLANAYRNRDKIPEAIAEYSRMLETGGRGDTRASRAWREAVHQLSEMGKTHPAALEPLRKARDKVDVSRALSTNNPEALQSLFAYNKALGEEAKSAGIYLTIPDSNAIKQRVFTQVFPQLVETRNYAAIVSMVDIETYVNSTYPRFLFEPGHSAHDGHDHSHQERAVKLRVDATTKSGIEVCMATGQLEKAKRLAARALENTENKKLADELIAAAKRADKPALAKEFETWLAGHLKAGK